jgi:crotonobetainyl-CoA:carnitine CoA-transferase CaiB-like acyl-CoA transferase
MAAMLEGVTILELGQVIAGNFGGVILADLGAEIIKIEPHRGDTARNPKIAPLGDHSAIHLFMNRGKKSVVLDLKSQQGLDIFYRLVEQADVVIDNFRPGVMARLGIDHATLKARNPDVITVTITGFGETGPLKDKAAFDLVVQAYSGHMEITGEPDGPPARAGVPLADISGGIYACISILGALVGRELHGGGQHADVAMLDSMVHLLAYDALDHLTTGNTVKRVGSGHAHMVPWQAFPVKDGYVVIAARDEKFWQNLCDAIGRDDLKTDPRSADNAQRVANREWLVPILEDAFREKTKAEWIRILDEFDIPSAPVNDFGDLFSDPHMEARRMVRSYEHPTLGQIRYQPSPMKLSDWEFPNRHAPMLGEHTLEILTSRLGLSEDEVNALDESGVVATWSA